MRVIVNEQSPKAKQSPFKNWLDRPPRLSVCDCLLVCVSSSVFIKLSSASSSPYLTLPAVYYGLCYSILTTFHLTHPSGTFSFSPSSSNLFFILYLFSYLRKKIPQPILPSLYWKSPSSAPNSCDRDCFLSALSRDQLEKEHAVHILSPNSFSP